MSIKFLVWGGGGKFWFGGGGEVPILFFMGAGIFLTLSRSFRVAGVEDARVNEGCKT